MPPPIIIAWITIGFIISRLHAEATIIRRLKIRIDQMRSSNAWHRKCQERKPIAKFMEFRHGTDEILNGRYKRQAQALFADGLRETFEQQRENV